jgi:hypothetical protein
MSLKTLKNPKSYNKITNNSKLLNVIDYALTSFCTSLGFNKTYFSVFLPYSDSQFPKYINSKDDTHNLKITDLEIILENLDSSHTKLILDSLCQSNGFICVDSAELEKDESPIEKLLLKASASNGDLANTFIKALEDGKITDEEKQELANIAYDFRKLLVTFEHNLNNIT